jgi:alpha-amylase/alpha-mannosidase (GH57 family)
MNSKTMALLLLAVAAFSLFRIVSQWRGVSRKRGSFDWDEQFIQQLRKAGVNTFEDQLVDFFFTLPTREAGDKLAEQLKGDGYTVDSKPDDTGKSISFHAQKRMRLIVPEMQAITKRFNQLAAEQGGSYDNWAVAKS